MRRAARGVETGQGGNNPETPPASLTNTSAKPEDAAPSPALRPGLTGGAGDAGQGVILAGLAAGTDARDVGGRQLGCGQTHGGVNGGMKESSARTPAP